MSGMALPWDLFRRVGLDAMVMVRIHRFLNPFNRIQGGQPQCSMAVTTDLAS